MPTLSEIDLFLLIWYPEQKRRCEVESLREYLHGQGFAIPSKYYFEYILDEQGQPVPTEDSHAAALLLHDVRKRKIEETHLTLRGVKVMVSTVFLVHNAQYDMDKPPILWETMTFTNDKASLDTWQDRYYTREAAGEGHKAMVARVLRELKRHPRSTRRMKGAAKKHP